MISCSPWRTSWWTGTSEGTVFHKTVQILCKEKRACRKTRKSSTIGKEDRYERNPSGVSFVCNSPSGGIYAPGRSPPPAGGGIQTPAPRAAFASEGGGPTCPPPFAAPGRRRKPGLAAATERTHCGRQGPPWRRATGGPRPILTRPGDGPERAQGWPPPPGRPEAPKNHPAATGGRLQPARRAARSAPQARPLDADHLGGGQSDDCAARIPFSFGPIHGAKQRRRGDSPEPGRRGGGPCARRPGGTGGGRYGAGAGATPGRGWGGAWPES